MAVLEQALRNDRDLLSVQGVGVILHPWFIIGVLNGARKSCHVVAWDSWLPRGGPCGAVAPLLLERGAEDKFSVVA
jgi:hypothetical protein